MNDVPSDVISKIMVSSNIEMLKVGEGQVICVPDTVTTYGEVIEDLDNSNSRQNLQRRCIGAERFFGKTVHVVFMVCNNIVIIRGDDCLKKFPFQIYESPITII